MSPNLFLRIGGLAKKLFGMSERAEEIRAQTEHDDIQEFHKTGRVSGLHLWLYAKVLFALLGILILCAVLFSETASGNLAALFGWMFAGGE